MADNLKHELPRDFSIGCSGSFYSLSATLRTAEDARAVIWALSLLTKTLPSHRAMVAGDIGLPEPPPPTFMDKVREAGLADG